MIGAVIKDNIVHNVIVMDKSQIEKMSKALNAEIVDSRPYGLSIGDVRIGDKWVRNAGGDNLILQPMEEEHYDSWAMLMRRTIEAEEALAAVTSRLDEQDKALVELAATIYVRPIRANSGFTLDDVPARWRAQVEEALNNEEAGK